MAQSPQQQFLDQLPPILIVSCSIVVDQSIRSDLFEDRFRNQVWLWLCALLSLHTHTQNQEDEKYDALIFETWIHLVIVSNLVSIGGLAALGPLKRIQKTNKMTWWLPFSAWNAMMASSCLFSGFYDTTAMVSVQVYVASLILLWIFQWHKKRKEKLDKELRRITNNSNISYPTVFISSNAKEYGKGGRIDESDWYNWKLSKTLQWISQVFTSQEDDDTVIIQQLASHQIDGALLDTLTVSQLLALQVPYGNAVRLVHAIQTKLIRKHPKPRGAEIAITTTEKFVRSVAQPLHNDWLSTFDQEYNSNQRGGRIVSDKPSIETHHEMNKVDVTTIHPEQEARVDSIMKERFGLELPKLKLDKQETETQEERFTHPLMDNPKPRSKPQPKLAPVANISNDHSPADDSGPMEGIPTALLDKMPARIQEIAKRRPELVQELLRNRQLQLPLQQQQSSNLSTLLEEQHNFSDGDQEADDDETTSLIRRKSRQAMYDSTDHVV